MPELDIIITLLIVVAAVALLANGRLRIDLVAICVLIALLLFGLIAPEQALAGFASPATGTIAAMFVISAGLVRTGSVAITSGGNLKARYVIHAVGPIYDGEPRAAELLTSAVHAALRMAEDHGLRSITLPPVSTGIFGYPMDEAAHVMLNAAITYLQGQTRLMRVVFCLADQPTFDIFAQELATQVPL